MACGHGALASSVHISFFPICYYSNCLGVYLCICAYVLNMYISVCLSVFVCISIFILSLYVLDVLY